MVGMLAALIGAALWVTIATYFGLPVSTTHSIVGAVMGFVMVVNMALIGANIAVFIVGMVAPWLLLPGARSY
jgi:PiT family inorganic phosphate transporter